MYYLEKTKHPARRLSRWQSVQEFSDFKGAADFIESFSKWSERHTSAYRIRGPEGHLIWESAKPRARIEVSCGGKWVTLDSCYGRKNKTILAMWDLLKEMKPSEDYQLAKGDEVLDTYWG